MEQPYGARAIIRDDFTQIQIIIPSRKNWLVIIFLSLWMCGWVLGEVFAAGGIIAGLRAGRPLLLFLLVWLAGWTIGGFFAFSMLLWQIAGKEIITFEPGRLTITKKGNLLQRAKTYDLNQVRNLRVQDNGVDSETHWMSRRPGLSTLMPPGIIRFSYGFKTVKFAGGIDEPEAEYILQQVRLKKLLPAIQEQPGQ